MHKVEVLVIEDDGSDRFWLEYVLKMFDPNCSFSSVTDGRQALDFLLKRGPYSNAPDPDLIFLDIHLPILNGIEILRQVPNAHRLPICVLTGSDRESMLFQQEFGIEGSNYLIKPISHESILESSCCQSHLGIIGYLAPRGLATAPAQ